MTSWQPGDRVRVRLDDDVPPRARYGMIAAVVDADDHVAVIISDDDATVRQVMVARHLVEPLDALAIELRLPATDLATSSPLRAGLAEMWRAEAVRAGLGLASWRLLGTPPGAGLMASSDAWVVAEFVAGGEQLVVGVSVDPHAEPPVTVRAHRPNRWDL